MKKVYLSIFCLLSILTLKAKENPTKALVDSTEKKSPLTINGSVDTYYFGNFNSPKSMSNLGAAGTARVFDQKSGQFQLGLAQIKTTYSTSKVDGVIDLVFGNHADLANYGNVVSPLTGTTSTALAIKQAYLTWKATDKLSITAGHFATHIGYEVIDAASNYNYSLSNLFITQPLYHTGVKASYSFSDKFSFVAGLVNGIDSKDAISRSKGVILQAVVTPKTGYTVYANYISSEEAVGTYSLVDIVGNFQITPKYYAGLNVDFGSLAGKSWTGYALYSNYAISDKFGLGVRYDHMDNSNGGNLILLNGAGTTVSSLTLTGNITISENLLLKPEFRLDTYPSGGKGKEQFEDSNGGFTNSSQATFGAAFVFHF